MDDDGNFFQILLKNLSVLFIDKSYLFPFYMALYFPNAQALKGSYCSRKMLHGLKNFQDRQVLTVA